MEFMIVFTGLLIVVATVTLPLYNRTQVDAEKLTALAEAREAANAIAAAVNMVYAGGPGSKVTIEYWLPKNVLQVKIGGYEELEIDGIQTSDATINANGRADIQIKMDFSGKGIWDNRRETVVLIDTALPSRWEENGNSRSNDWIRENGVHVEENNLRAGTAYGTPSMRTLHRTTFTYRYDPAPLYKRRILISDEITGGA
jgi:hypothetical protein